MADKYGLLDAHYFLFECTFNGERVEDRCTRGNDVDGWVDLFPVDAEGRITSVAATRRRGEVVFSNVRIAQRHGYLTSTLVEDFYQLRERVAEVRLASIVSTSEIELLRAELDPLRPLVEKTSGVLEQLLGELAKEPALEPGAATPVQPAPVEGVRVGG